MNADPKSRCKQYNLPSAVFFGLVAILVLGAFSGPGEAAATVGPPILSGSEADYFPYMSLHGALVVQTGTNDISDLSDLSGRRAAVMKGDNAKDRRLVIGGDHNYPPYEYLDERGRPAGYNVELTRAIAREIGLDIEIRLGPWAEIRQALARGEIDALQGMFYSPERDLTFDFTPPHTVNHCVGVVRKGEGPPPATVGDLAGKRIVVQRGDIMHDFAVENGLGGQVTTVDAQEDALRELAEGKHDCAFVARLTAMYWIKKHGWDNLTVGNHPFLSPEYCYAVPNNQKALLAHFSEGLQVLEKTGEYRHIYEKWMGVYEDSPPSLVTALRYAAVVVTPLLLLLLAFFLWSWSLRKQVESRTKELHESERLLAAIIDAIAAPVFYKNAQGAYTGCNRAFSTLLGLPKESIIGKTVFDVAPGDLAQQYHDADLALMKEGDVQIYEIEVEGNRGARRKVMLHKAPFRGPDGKVKGVVGAMLDISELKLAQERIEHLNHVLRGIRDVNQLIVRERNRDTLIREGCRLLVDNRGYAYSLIVLTDQKGRPVSWAEAGMRASSESLSSVLETCELPPCFDLARPAEDVLRIQDQDDVCSGCPIAALCAGVDCMCVRLTSDGNTFGYLAVVVKHGLGVDLEERTLLAEMAEDIAYALRVLQMDEAREKIEQEHKSLQSQMLQAQKMESVGRLAGGVAHDYNNMLSVIIGYAELALDKVDPSEPLHADLKEILNAAGRSTDITRQLLAFARKQTISPKVLDLNETVEGMLKMLRRLIGEDIDLAWLPESGLWPVKMDPAQIDQILANLCVNARDAIAGVGRVTIETDKMTFDEAYCTDRAGVVPGEFVLLAVSDDGCGMDKETMESIFEPFFTTKDVNRGTGLGLATVYGIVKQNSGFVNVYSEPGKGTTFKIYLPRHAGEVEEASGEIAAEIPPGRGETVLLVEDEPAIMKMGKTMLEKLGYRVLAAGTPSEAVRLAGEHAGGIHLLITDVVMPEINGRELADRLHTLYPDLKTLFMSGYTANVIAHRGVLDQGVHFIQKPFSLRDLAARVGEALGRIKGA